MATVTWSDAAAICRTCNRPFRISEAAIAAQLSENAGDRAAAVQSIDFCLGCVQGESPAGEHDVLGYYGYLYREAQHAWVILFCWKRNASERSRQRDTGVTFNTGDEAAGYVSRLNAAIARTI